MYHIQLCRRKYMKCLLCVFLDRRLCQTYVFYEIIKMNKPFKLSTVVALHTLAGYFCFKPTPLLIMNRSTILTP